MLIAGQVSLRDDQNPNIIADQIIELNPDQMKLPPSMQYYLDGANAHTDILYNNAQANGSFKQNKFITEQTNKPTSINDQFETQTDSNYLKLGIRWEQELDAEATKVLFSMLDYFSGDTPIYIFDSEGKLIINPEQPKYFDLNYLEQLTKRYSIESFLII